MEYTIAAIPHYLIDFMWPFVQSIIDSIIARAHGEMNIDTVKAKLKSDTALLVVCLEDTIVKGLVILQVEAFDTGLRVLNLSMAGGDVDIFTGEYDNVLLDIAKNLKCDEIRAIGARVGWDRFLNKKETNWKKISTTLTYKVEN
jgi:hypothetical protein